MQKPPVGIRGWVLDIVVGGLAGVVIGAIAAVNLVIFSGFERGYETGLDEVFKERPLTGILVVIFIAVGPALGVLGARLIRRRRRPTIIE
ncbi:MAG: hypothetical protein WBM90_00440 [Acidimicrobiia bacterium]